MGCAEAIALRAAPCQGAAGLWQAVPPLASLACPACAVPSEQAPSGQALPQEDLSGQQQQEGFQDPSGTDLGGDDFTFPDDGFGGDCGLHDSDAFPCVVSHQYRQVESGKHVDYAPDPHAGGPPAAAGYLGSLRSPPGGSPLLCWYSESSVAHVDVVGAIQLPVSAAMGMLQVHSGLS